MRKEKICSNGVRRGIEYSVVVILIELLLLVFGASNSSSGNTPFAFVQSVSPTVYHADPYANNAAAYYISGNTNASGLLQDYSVNARHATNVSSSSIFPVSTNSSGRVVYAEKFSGTGGPYFIIPGDSWATGSTVITYIAWVYATNWNDFAGIVYCYDANAGGSAGLRLGSHGSTTYGEWEGSSSRSTYSTANIVIYTNQIFTSNVWHYLAVQAPLGSITKGFYDGDVFTNLYGGDTYTNTVANQRYNFLIGYENSTVTRKFNGYITGVRIYTNCIFSMNDFTNDMNWSSPLTNTLLWPSGNYPLSVTALSGASAPYWSDTYSNSRAFYFNGDTNASGYAIDYSGYGRNASNFGSVASTPVGTNLGGRVQYALRFDGTSWMAIARSQSNGTNFLNGMTAVVFYAWVKITNSVQYAGICYNENATWHTWGLCQYAAAYSVNMSTTEGLSANGGAATNGWTFLAGVYAGSTTVGKLYINAANPISSSAGGDATLSITNFPIIGWTMDGDVTRKFQGYIGTLVLYTNNIPDLAHMTNFYNATSPLNNYLY